MNNKPQVVSKTASMLTQPSIKMEGIYKITIE